MDKEFLFRHMDEAFFYSFHYSSLLIVGFDYRFEPIPIFMKNIDYRPIPILYKVLFPCIDQHLKLSFDHTVT